MQKARKQMLDNNIGRECGGVARHWATKPKIAGVIPGTTVPH